MLVAVKQGQGVQDNGPQKSWSGKTEDRDTEDAADRVAGDGMTTTTTTSTEASSTLKDRSFVHKLPKVVAREDEEGKLTWLGNLDMEAIMELWGRQDCGGVREGASPHCSLMRQLNSSAGLLQVLY